MGTAEIYAEFISKFTSGDKLMRLGFTNKQIAEEFGVSNMFITNLKQEIREQMIFFGTEWPTRKKRRKKEFLTGVDLDKYVESVLTNKVVL